MTYTISEKYRDSPRSIDFLEIAKKSKIDLMLTESSLKQLTRVRDAIVELEDYDYKEYLTPNNANQIQSLKNTVNQVAKQIENFNIQDQNSSNSKVHIEQVISNLFQNFNDQALQFLIYLRQENSNTADIEKEAKKSISQTEALKKELELQLKTFQEKINQLETKENEVISKETFVSLSQLSKEFGDEFSALEKKVKFHWRNFFSAFVYSIFIPLLYLIGFLIIIAIGFVYFVFLPDLQTEARIEYSILTIAFSSLYFYLLRNLNRNKNIIMHNMSHNKHRRNVASTLEAFIKSGNNDLELKNKLLEYGVKAMFETENTGYLSKDQMEAINNTPGFGLIEKIITK